LLQGKTKEERSSEQFLRRKKGRRKVKARKPPDHPSQKQENEKEGGEK